jgi:hypothetical protein
MSPNTDDLRERVTEVATQWALMYPLANWPWLGPRGSGDADAMSLDGMARNIAAAWGRDIADRMLAVRDEELARLQARLAEEVAVSGLLARRAEASEGEHGVTREREAEQRRRADHAEAEILAARNRVAGLEANGAELLARVERAEAERDALKAERECTQQFLRTLVYTADVLAILDAPESPAPAPTAVTAATEAHGGAGEAQEAAQ